MLSKKDRPQVRSTNLYRFDLRTYKPKMKTCEMHTLLKNTGSIYELEKKALRFDLRTLFKYISHVCTVFGAFLCV